MKVFRIACISLCLTGAGLFLYSAQCLHSSSILNWCFGLASALIVLGLGYLMNTFSTTANADSKGHRRIASGDYDYIRVKEKAGFLVCKIMNILLCIQLLLLRLLQADFLFILISIVLIILQFSLDLVFQILYLKYLSKKNL